MSSMSIRKRATLSTILTILIPWCYLLYVAPSSAEDGFSSDTLSQGQELRDWEFLYSSNKNFRLRFYSHATSRDRYLGIFYSTNDYIPVWLANRDDPIRDASGSLRIYGSFLEILRSGGDPIVVNSNSSLITGPGGNISTNASATLLDDGNLVVRAVNQDGSINGMLWQSYDYPTDVLLPGMKLGINLRTGHRWSLTSWFKHDVPASGSFTLGLDSNGSSQLILRWLENAYWTSGPWQTDHFVNMPRLTSQSGIKFRYITNDNESYFTYSSDDQSQLLIALDAFGRISTRNAGFGYCDRSEESDPGCVRGMCEMRNRDEFIQRRGIVNGDGYTFPEIRSIGDCWVQCRLNCSCIAYASIDEVDETGCRIWTKDKAFKFRETSIYERPINESRTVYVFLGLRLRAKKRWMWPVVASAGGTVLVLSFLLFCILRRLRIRAAEKVLLHELVDTTRTQEMANGGEKEMSQVQQFTFKSVEIATNSFSVKNKLGEGGFGSVYKGELPGGQEVAIKRLSRSSGQGLAEFKNEILLIAKLQHNNLVRLLGCCIEGQELLLVYEYLHNKSLDFFIFDHSKRELLKWADRMSIIEGVAQGLVYLHKHSRLRVIHRDLKASNILLDENMKPKISDFGMARIFGKQEFEANTKRIVGTHGYMSPEYAINGIVSMKTDVFSFGVLVLEIVSGKKNRGCYHSERPLNLIGLAWELWHEERALELIDTTLDCANRTNEVKRTINIGLLCVQDSAADRPSMTVVVSMLTNEVLQLPAPKQPAFFIQTSTQEADEEAILENICTNEMSESLIEAR